MTQPIENGIKICCHLQKFHIQFTLNIRIKYFISNFFFVTRSEERTLVYNSLMFYKYAKAIICQRKKNSTETRKLFEVSRRLLLSSPFNNIVNNNLYLLKISIRNSILLETENRLCIQGVSAIYVNISPSDREQCCSKIPYLKISRR